MKLDEMLQKMCERDGADGAPPLEDNSMWKWMKQKQALVKEAGYCLVVADAQFREMQEDYGQEAMDAMEMREAHVAVRKNEVVFHMKNGMLLPILVGKDDGRVGTSVGWFIHAWKLKGQRFVVLCERPVPVVRIVEAPRALQRFNTNTDGSRTRTTQLLTAATTVQHIYSVGLCIESRSRSEACCSKWKRSYVADHDLAPPVCIYLREVESHALRNTSSKCTLEFVVKDGSRPLLFHECDVKFVDAEDRGLGESIPLQYINEEAETKRKRTAGDSDEDGNGTKPERLVCMRCSPGRVPTLFKLCSDLLEKASGKASGKTRQGECTSPTSVLYGPS